MIKPNEQFLKQQFYLAFGEEKAESNKYIIDFDPNENQEPKSNFDEIMVFRVIPDVIGTEMNLHEVCDKLITSRNEIPLWIKAVSMSENKVQLLISKRFRKKPIIEEWHQDNQFMPLLITK